MIRLFEECCHFCRFEDTVSEGEYIFEGGTELLDDGETIDIPSFINNEQRAKKWFELHGWLYVNEHVLCKGCFNKLKNGYVVLDRFNQFYDFSDCQEAYDFPEISCVMNKQEAINFSRYKYNDESVTYHEALDIVLKFLKDEIKSDSMGYSKEHPYISMLVDDIERKGHFRFYWKRSEV